MNNPNLRDVPAVIDEADHTDAYYLLHGQLRVIGLFYPNLYDELDSHIGNLEDFISAHPNPTAVILRHVSNSLHLYNIVLMLKILLLKNFRKQLKNMVNQDAVFFFTRTR